VQAAFTYFGFGLTRAFKRIRQKEVLHLFYLKRLKAKKYFTVTWFVAIGIYLCRKYNTDEK